MLKTLLILGGLGWLAAGCAPLASELAATVPPVADPAPCLESGDIVVSNSGSDAVLALHPDGSFKRVVYNVTNYTETVFGLHWSALNRELFVTVDGVDRVVAVRASDCEARSLVLDPQLSGTIRGITALASGDLLVVETNNIERFSSDGVRVVTGGWPKALQTTGTGIRGMSSGGFVHCSTGSALVRTYDASGVQLANRVSGIAGTTQAADCMALADGSVAVAWTGTTDTVSIYSSNLGTLLASFSNLTVLATPGGIAQRGNGNLLVADRALNYLVELTANGTFVRIVGDSVLSTPEMVLVVP
jgi:hypothetical protein